MSFTLRPFASAALLLSMAGLCAGTLLAAEQTEPSEASAVRARPLVLGVVETAEPSFDDNTVRPVLKAMQSAAPGTQIDVVRLSSATFEVAVAQLKPDLVISPAADFLRIVDSIGAHPIGTRKTKYAKHPRQAPVEICGRRSHRSRLTHGHSKTHRSAGQIYRRDAAYLGRRHACRTHGIG